MQSISTNPILTLKIDSNIINNEDMCKFVPSPANLTIQLNNYQKVSEDEIQILTAALSV